MIEVSIQRPGQSSERKKLLCNHALITMELAEEGVIYERDALGINRYEAVLRTEADGEVFYCAGGSGPLESQATDQAAREAHLRQRAWHVFRHLVWWAACPNSYRSTAVVAKLVATHAPNP